ncbi:MAG: helix-turn-helix domain-containing protein [Chloroflexota bacterium]|nr:helix-turn-helix domain-containing protein [Chloroflexota bacterium]
MIINRLAEVMDRKGVTVSALSRGACISRGAAHKLYHGTGEGLSLEVLDKVCSFLEVQVGDVLVWAPEGSQAARLEQARREQLEAENLLLATLEQLLGIEATELKGTLDRASGLIAAAIGAHKVDVFLYDPSIDTLVAQGASDTPMARRQGELGLDRMPVSNGGSLVGVYRSGASYVTGCAWKDPDVPAGLIEGLQAQSVAAVPLDVDGVRRGILCALSQAPDAFTHDEAEFLVAVAKWVGMLVHRAELVDRVARDALRQGMRAAADDLVGAIGHDLGSHLSPLRTRVDSLWRRARREGRHKDLEDVEAASEELGRLRGLLADLLELGKLGGETATLRGRRLDLVALVEATAGDLGGEGKVRVQVPEEAMVRADADRARQAVRALLVTALESAPDGVPVAAELSVGPGYDRRWAELSVRSEAPSGVEELNSSRSVPRNLGLYVARAIAEAHEGELTAETTGTEGMVFRLRLPVDDDRASQ